MGRKRLKFLFNNLMFDDVATREVDWQQDRFTTIREFFEIFNRKCMNYVIPSEYLSNWLYERDIIIGTLMTNRIGIPAEIKKTGNRPELCTTVHWEAEEKNLVLCPYAVKTKSKGMKSVLLLSTMSVIRSYTC